LIIGNCTVNTEFFNLVFLGTSLNLTEAGPIHYCCESINDGEVLVGLLHNSPPVTSSDVISARDPLLQQQQQTAAPAPPTTAWGSQAPAAEPEGWGYHLAGSPMGPPAVQSPVAQSPVARPAPTPASGPLNLSGGGGGGVPPVTLQEFHPHSALQVPLSVWFSLSAVRCGSFILGSVILNY
jgi:hypothetical protein